MLISRPFFRQCYWIFADCSMSKVEKTVEVPVSRLFLTTARNPSPKSLLSIPRSQTVTFSNFFFLFTLCLVLQNWNQSSCQIFELDNELEDYLINILIKLPSLNNLRPNTNVKFQMPSFIQELTACDEQHLNQLHLTVLNQIRLCGTCD